MKNKLIIFIILLAFFPYCYSQTSSTGSVDIKVTVKYGKNLVEGAIIDLYDGSIKLNTYTTNFSGKIDIKLDFDKEYTLSISKENLVTKKVTINTTINKGKEFVYPYKFTIELFDYVKGLDISALSKPVTKIKYFDNLDDFDFDPDYTESMRKEIEKIMSQLDFLTKKNYTDLIQEADALFRGKKYKEAHDKYEDAIYYAPEFDYYPEEQLDKCLKLMAQQESGEKEYEKLIQTADNYFNAANYNVAKTDYQSASKLKPTEQYPKDKIAECDKLLAEKIANEEKMALEKNYQDAITKADANFTKKLYAEAKTLYSTASGLKPSEQYPKDKIAEIDKILGDQLAATEKEKAYKDAILKADGQFTRKEYNEAKSSYNTASGLKPSEQYPKDKIAAIDKILADQLAAAEKEKAYQDAIKKADGHFTNKEYNEAKASYTTASGLKPTEQYPKNKIIAIDKILADQMAAAEKEKAYQDAITKADGHFTNKEYNEAKTSYTTAGGLKPTEQYPKSKITEIDKILADQMATAQKEKAYQDAITKADASFTKNLYAEAKASYSTATGLKPSEQYPKDKIAEIDKILADQLAATEKEKAYKDAILKADGQFARKEYNEAKTSYSTASGLKPSEQYPKDKIAAIDKILADQLAAAEKDKAYQDVITKADGQFTNKQYTEA
ncbi:MAG: hypothetical protein ABIJ97_18025, partial [Bacteroidota bacterium]